MYGEEGVIEAAMAGLTMRLAALDEMGIDLPSPTPDTIASLRDDYACGHIEIEAFERRVGELLADE